MVTFGRGCWGWHPRKTIDPAQMYFCTFIQFTQILQVPPTVPTSAFGGSSLGRFAPSLAPPAAGAPWSYGPYRPFVFFLLILPHVCTEPNVGRSTLPPLLRSNWQKHCNPSEYIQNWRTKLVALPHGNIWAGMLRMPSQKDNWPRPDVGFGCHGCTSYD
jgi:hypothetical protein